MHACMFNHPRYLLVSNLVLSRNLNARQSRPGSPSIHLYIEAGAGLAMIYSVRE